MSIPMEYSKQFQGRQATQALHQALKLGGKTRTGAYKALIEIWSVQIDRARVGDIDAAKLIIERLEGKAAAKVDVTHDFSESVIEALDAGRRRVAAAREAERAAIESTAIVIEDSDDDVSDDDA